jgi:hypothetical protein
VENPPVPHRRSDKTARNRRSVNAPSTIAVVIFLSLSESGTAPMKYVCDAPERMTWFRIETEFEAEQEAALMTHAVDKHFRRECAAAARTFKPASTVFIEQNIGLKAHIQETMPLFVTLRDHDGNAHVTAMLPPRGHDDPTFRMIIVGRANGDPYPEFEMAIHSLADHFGLSLDREQCFPYARRPEAAYDIG